MPSAIMPTPASWHARQHAGEDAGATSRGPGGSLLREHDLPVHALVEQRGVRSQGVFGIGLKIDVLSPHVVLKVMDLRDSLGNPAPADTVCVSDVLLAVDGKSVENVRQRPATQRAQPLVLCPVSLSFGPCSRRVARRVSCVCPTLAEGCVGPGEHHSRPESCVRLALRSSGMHSST